MQTSEIIFKFCEMFLHYPKGLFIMLVINYVWVSAGPLVLHAECSPCKLVSMLLKKKFLHALFLCQKFWSLWKKGEKYSKWLQANWLRALFLRFLNKFVLKSIGYSMFWENMSSDFIFHLYWKLDFQNWYFSHFGTLRKIRYATVVLIVLNVECLICFLKFQQFDGHNFIFRKSRGKLKKAP